MIVKNPWVGYLDRSFQQIKTRILLRLGETIPEISDHSDSNILVIVIEAFAGVSEQLNYYIDNMARESFITTARRYSSVVKHTRLIDYRIKAVVPASVDITLEFKNTDGTPYTIISDTIIPSGTVFLTNNNLPFITTNDTIAYAGSNSIVVFAKQKSIVINDILGLVSNDPEAVISLGKDYVHNSIELKIQGEPWTYVETLGFSGPLDKHFIVDISASKEAYIRFGDNINGLLPTAGLEVLGTYYISAGELGNINIDTIKTSVQPLNTLLNIPKVDFSNNFRATGGTNYENIERIRRSAPLSLRTLNRAVTRKDYEDIALLCPGVDKAKLFFDCGKYIDIYIAPNGGGTAGAGFLKDVETYFEDKKMVSTFVRPLPCGESYIYLDLVVTGKFRVDGPKLRNDILNLLLDKYSYQNSDINKPLRISDFISLIDNYPNVDYLKLNSIYLKPYIRPTGLSNNQSSLVYTIKVNSGSVETLDWKLKYNGTNMLLFKGNSPLANIEVGTTYTDPLNIFTITIQNNFYQPGMEWEFKTFSINQDILVDDYSVPVILEENINLIVNEKLTI